MRLLLCSLLLAPTDALRVLVTGAGGRTGKLIFQKLNEDYKDVEPLGLVRSKKAKKAMRKVARMCYPLQEKVTALRVKETRQEEKKARRAGSAGRTPSIRVHSALSAAALPPGRHRAPRAHSRASRTLMRLAPSGRRLGRC